MKKWKIRDTACMVGGGLLTGLMLGALYYFYLGFALTDSLLCGLLTPFGTLLIIFLFITLGISFCRRSVRALSLWTCASLLAFGCAIHICVLWKVPFEMGLKCRLKAEFESTSSFRSEPNGDLPKPRENYIQDRYLSDSRREMFYSVFSGDFNFGRRTALIVKNVPVLSYGSRSSPIVLFVCPKKQEAEFRVLKFEILKIEGWPVAWKWRSASWWIFS